MTSTLDDPAATFVLPERDSLFELQLRIARRADELAGQTLEPRAPVWLAWFQAEREAFGVLEPTVRGDEGSSRERSDMALVTGLLTSHSVPRD